MGNYINTGFSQQGEIYTLAQSGTTKVKKVVPNTIVSGVGTNVSDDNKLRNKAKRKIITNRTLLSLIDIAKEKGDSDRVGQYWRTYNCHSKLIRYGSIVYGNYCKNKCCTVCSAIRKAEIINKYKPILANWKDVYFVTLTVKACKEDKLNKLVNASYRAMNLMLNRLKKRHQRNKGIKVMGIKSFECNFNPKKKSYNPHFHLLVPSKEVAMLLINEWLLTWKSKDGRKKFFYASRKGQDMRPLKNLESALIETIKYGAKIFIDPDMKKDKKQSTNPMIYAYALDNIYAAMKGKRLFDRFGFNLPPQPVKESQIKTIVNPELWKYSTNDADWINKETGECLTGYAIPPELDYLLSECINKSNH